MKSVKSVQINNEEFLKSLFNELRIVNNEYSIKSSYISKLEKESKSDEEEKSSSDSDKEKMNFKYLVSSTVSESDFNNFNPELIDEYQDDTKYLESKLTIILSSILVNITNWVLKKNKVEEGRSSSPRNENREGVQNTSYSIGFLERVIKSEIDDGLLEILNLKNPTQIR